MSATATSIDRTHRDKALVMELIAGMAKARYEKNARAIAAPYATDAAIYNLAPPMVHHGIDLQETQAWLDTWEGPITIEPRDFEVTLAGDTAFAHGYMRMTGRKKGADHDVDFWMRETLCLARNGAGWQIVHEHTSVPFYMDGSSRPAFDLEP
ncbi:MAG: nuclear transport factor 2 family protein [Acidobacteriaceae bacterium]